MESSRSRPISVGSESEKSTALCVGEPQDPDLLQVRHHQARETERNPMQNQSEHNEHRLNQELDAVLRPLGVQQEGRKAPPGQQNSDLQITCLYSDMDATIWNGLQPSLALIQHRKPGMK